MTKMSDLPWELTEEVLSRLPLTSLRAARFTCKKWNMISKDQSFTKKHLSEAKAAAKRKEFQMVMMLEHRLYLVRINLLKPSIDRIGKLISLDDADRVNISTIFHCDGLLLCITKDIPRLVVWNLYSGEKSWIEPRKSYDCLDMYAIGYEKKNNLLHSHKILRFNDRYNHISGYVRECEIFDLNSNLWKVVDVTPNWLIELSCDGLTLKGNTYWFAQKKLEQGRWISDLPGFLICFNFTTERFGPRLPFPFQASLRGTVSLSSVRDEQLAVLYTPDTAEHTVKIWISNKIEPNAVSWNSMLLSVDMKNLFGCVYCEFAGSFFVDEEKKLAVVLQTEIITYVYPYRDITRNIASIIGENGYFRKVDLGDSFDYGCWPLVCSYF